MGLVRVQKTVQQTLTHTSVVDEVLTDYAGAVTVTVKRLDGTSIVGSPFTATHGTVGVYTLALPAQAQVDTLTVDWTGSLAGATVTTRDIVEIVGGFYFGLAEVRTEFTLSATTYPTATLARKRVEVEQECDAISGQAWVPRFARFLLDGTGTNELVVPDMALRTCRAASVAVQAGGTFVALTAGELAAIAAKPSGVLIRDDGGVWPLGHSNVIVEYEHGADSPTLEISSASMRRLRSKLGVPKSSIPDRALSFTLTDGGVYRLTNAGRRSTGIPDVDAAYLRAALEKVWIAS